MTGATDGIGKAYCELLAKKGFNIVLISRTQEKLTDVARQIGKQKKVVGRHIFNALYRKCDTFNYKSMYANMK